MIKVCFVFVRILSAATSIWGTDLMSCILVRLLLVKLYIIYLTQLFICCFIRLLKSAMKKRKQMFVRAVPLFPTQTFLHLNETISAPKGTHRRIFYSVSLDCHRCLYLGAVNLYICKERRLIRISADVSFILRVSWIPRVSPKDSRILTKKKVGRDHPLQNISAHH
jgi:hypothetical protein